MTDEQINRLIHEKIMGERDECLPIPILSRARCIRETNGCLRDHSVPGYATDLNAVALAEAKVIAANGLYFTAIRDVIGWNTHPHLWVTATARQRAEACLRAMDLWEGK